MYSDAVYEAAAELLPQVQEAHVQLYDDLNMFDHPGIILCACYQDGMMHGLKRILRRRNCGEYSHPCKILGTASAYARLRSEKLKAKRYDDVAYIDGYVNALMYVEVAGSDEPENIPPLFHAPGFDGVLCTIEEYRRLLPRMPKLHKGAFRYAQRAVGQYSAFKDRGIVMHHHCAL
jgi:hypothetical protein